MQVGAAPAPPMTSICTTALVASSDMTVTLMEPSGSVNDPPAARPSNVVVEGFMSSSHVQLLVLVGALMSSVAYTYTPCVTLLSWPVLVRYSRK